MSDVNETKATKINGYATCVDTEDRDLRIRNQATILCNILEDHATVSAKGERVSAKGASTAISYFKQIAKADQQAVLAAVSELQVAAGRVVTMH